MKLLSQKLVFVLLLFCGACKGPGLFTKKQTPHEQYVAKLKSAGLDKTVLGRKWMDAAQQSLLMPLTVSIPYSETGYFAAEKPAAVGLKIELIRGEKINITIKQKAESPAKVFADLMRGNADSTSFKVVASADTLSNHFEYEVDKGGRYLLRVQPELLASAEYELRITSGPSLAFPVENGRIESIWGDPRDAGVRRHEGVDIFAPRHTPALAAADGRVSRVNENKLGGKAVWLNVPNKDYVLYYAHLDKQLVSDGQEVEIGDTLGLVGNTGNARTTPPHLHFGIYSVGGAIDPFPFVNPVIRNPRPITALRELVGKEARVKSKADLFLDNDMHSGQQTIDRLNLIYVSAATDGMYKVITPDGRNGFVSAASIVSLSTIKSQKMGREEALLDAPTASAAAKRLLKPGEEVQVLASFLEFQYVKDGKNNFGWIAEE